MGRTGLTPALAKRFRSGRVSLDFAHTAGEPELAEPELIDGAPALQRWLSHVLDGADVRVDADDVAAALRLRTALWQLVHARTQDRDLPRRAVDTVNRFAVAAPPAPRLTLDGHVASGGVSAAEALSALARDAIDLLGGPLGHRIRVCAGPGCQLLFVDASRPGTRRWCSMERCGNLAKVRTHRTGRAGE
ncbi:CGNR zinc finger domain-containing protein [Nakamurella endophytica]|uniref:CGNR zinc finger domain-containing protein n=1 Tax=Nakamurella endophytica TaxID=1748367 RepID=UPI001665B9AB|nr:CGNR zinc finger domain-containing protein [Nakamurella endophytica]